MGIQKSYHERHEKSTFCLRWDSTRGHILCGEYAGENADGYESENKANFKEIYDRSGDKKTDYIRGWPDAAKKIDDVNIGTIDPLIEI